MSKKSALILAIVALASSIGLIILLVFSESLNTQGLLQDRVFYITLVLLGIFSGISLYGFQKYKASISGQLRGLQVEVRGPAALATAIVVGGFFLIPQKKEFDVTILAVDEEGKPVYDVRKAEATLLLPTGVRSAEFTSNGEAVIKGIPSKLKGAECSVIVDIYFHKQASRPQKIKLGSDSVTVKMLDDPKGTTEGITNALKANLAVAKLLLPYRLINYGSDSGEFDIAQYRTKEFKERALQVDLNAPIRLSKDELFDHCDIISEHAPELLNLGQITYAQLIQKTAVSYRRDVSMLSQIDKAGIDPEIQRELIKINSMAFVTIACGINPHRNAPEYLDIEFWEHLGSDLDRVNPKYINLFTTFSGF